MYLLLKIAQRVRHWALSDQGQGHGVTYKFTPFKTIQTVKYSISAWAGSRKLRLSVFVYCQ